MSIDRKIAKFEAASADKQKKMLTKLSDLADDREAKGDEAGALKIHQAIANCKVAVTDIDAEDSFDESAVMDQLANLDPNADLSGTALGSMLEGFMDDTSDLINMSREYCEEAGIACPPSYSKQHQMDFENRPADLQLPAEIMQLVTGLGIDEHTITYLFPKPHPDNQWDGVLNVAFDNGSDSTTYLTLLAYVEQHGLVESDDLEFLPRNQAEYDERKAGEVRVHDQIAAFLTQNNARAETKLRWLVEQAKGIGATSVMLTDHPDYGLEMGICEHDGKGTINGSLSLLDNYHDWSLAQSDDDDDDYLLYGSQTWPWVRDRWLAIGGPESGVHVVIFANGVGDTYDLNTGAEADEAFMDNVF